MVAAVCLMGIAGTWMYPTAAYGQFFYMENEDIGKEVKDFSLKMVGGKTASLSEYRNGQKSVIFFWATWCPHCREQLNELNKEKDGIFQKDIKLVIVDVGENEATVDRYLKKNKIDLDVFLDEESAVSDEYELIGVPTFYFVNEQGIVTDVQHSLPKDWNEVFQAT